MRLFALALTSFVALFALPARADSVSCDGGYVSVDDTKLDLLGKCGEPTLIEARLDQQTTSQTDASGQTAATRTVRTPVEVWTYNFGPQRFLQYVTIAAGKVVSISTGGYGFVRAVPKAKGAPVPVARCDALRSLSLGH